MIALVTALSLGLAAWPSGLVHANKSKEELQKELDSIEEKKGNVAKDLDNIKKEIEPLKKKMSDADRKLEKTEKELDKVEKKLDKAKKELDKYDDVFRKRVREIYIRGEMGSLESLLQAESFGEFLARFEFLRLIVKQDYAVVKDYYDKKEEVQTAYDKLKKLQKEQKKDFAEAKKAYDELAQKMEKYQGQLKDLEHEESITKKELQELDLSNLRVGNFPYQGPLSRPVNGPVTSGYGYRGSEFHTGIDYGAPIGTPIYAAANGRVVRAQSCGCGYGYYIMIYHGGGVYSLYAHMYSYTSRVSVGQVVKRGQQIAAVGNNGRSTGPHLHFEVHSPSPGNYRNPLNYMQ